MIRYFLVKYDDELLCGAQCTAQEGETPLFVLEYKGRQVEEYFFQGRLAGRICSKPLYVYEINQAQYSTYSLFFDIPLIQRDVHDIERTYVLAGQTCRVFKIELDGLLDPLVGVGERKLENAPLDELAATWPRVLKSAKVFGSNDC